MVIRGDDTIFRYSYEDTNEDTATVLDQLDPKAVLTHWVEVDLKTR